MIAAPAFAQVSKCTDAAGKISYQQNPCQQATKRELLDVRTPEQKTADAAAAREVERGAVIKRERDERAAVDEARRQVMRERASQERASGPPRDVPRIGMTKDQAARSLWRSPDSVNITETSAGTREQWVYSLGYLYFENGILTAIQKKGW